MGVEGIGGLLSLKRPSGLYEPLGLFLVFDL